ncbi:MAG: hypothetical protein RQM92_15440 [Candidatus Syntrophopropionicum ammoniitolerans]
MDRKKELKLQYKQMKPEMGIFIIRSKVNGRYFLKGAPRLTGWAQRDEGQTEMWPSPVPGIPEGMG